MQGCACHRTRSTASAYAMPRSTDAVLWCVAPGCATTSAAPTHCGTTCLCTQLCLVLDVCRDTDTGMILDRKGRQEAHALDDSAEARQTAAIVNDLSNVMRSILEAQCLVNLTWHHSHDQRS